MSKIKTALKWMADMYNKHVSELDAYDRHVSVIAQAYAKYRIEKERGRIVRELNDQKEIVSGNTIITSDWIFIDQAIKIVNDEEG